MCTSPRWINEGCTAPWTVKSSTNRIRMEGWSIHYAVISLSSPCRWHPQCTSSEFEYVVWSCVYTVDQVCSSRGCSYHHSDLTSSMHCSNSSMITCYDPLKLIFDEKTGDDENEYCKVTRDADQLQNMKRHFSNSSKFHVALSEAMCMMLC